MWIILGITYPVVSLLSDPRIYPHLWITCGRVRINPSWETTAPVDEVALSGDKQPVFFLHPHTSGCHPHAHPQPVLRETILIYEAITGYAQNPHPL